MITNWQNVSRPFDDGISLSPPRQSRIIVCVQFAFASPVTQLIHSAQLTLFYFCFSYVLFHSYFACATALTHCLSSN